MSQTVSVQKENSASTFVPPKTSLAPQRSPQADSTQAFVPRDTGLQMSTDWSVQASPEEGLTMEDIDKQLASPSSGFMDKLVSGAEEAPNTESVGVQPKLAIGQVGDPYEVEADQVADKVMRMPEPLEEQSSKNQGEVVQRQPVALSISRLVQLQEMRSHSAQPKRQSQLDKEFDFNNSQTAQTSQVAPNVSNNPQNNLSTPNADQQATISLIFDEQLYLNQNPDIAQAVASGQVKSGFEHFILHGFNEGRSLGLFDEQFYLRQNPDIAQVVASGQLRSGLEHFIRYGANENRQPNPSGLRGLAKKPIINQFVSGAKQTGWANLRTANERAAALLETVNQQLITVGVPPCKLSVMALGNAAGQFEFSSWTMKLNQELFSEPTLTNEEAANMAEVVYHEARHAEQWSRMARMLAGRGKSAQAIASEMSIPPEIAQDAISKPLKQGKQGALEAERWYESVYGAQKNDRNQVLSELDAVANAFKQADEEFRRSPTPENEARRDDAYQQYQVVYQKYRSLPEEADAFRVGGAVGYAYRNP